MKPAGPLTKAGTTPFADFIRNAPEAEKREVYMGVLKRATERQNEIGAQAMTDKAAREAFEKLHHNWQLDRKPDGSYWFDVAQIEWRGFANGYQTAHDAAMAAEPDVQLLVSRLREENWMQAAGIVESLALQLQAAQQREAECRKDAERYRWLRDTDGPLYIVNGNSALEPDEADAYIDAALATQPASPTPDSD